MLHAAKDGNSERLLKCLNFANSDINAVNKVLRKFRVFNTSGFQTNVLLTYCLSLICNKNGSLLNTHFFEFCTDFLNLFVLVKFDKLL